MRRLLIVLALLAMMVGLRTLQTQDAAPGTDPTTLAAIGFVVPRSRWPSWAGVSRCPRSPATS